MAFAAALTLSLLFAPTPAKSDPPSQQENQERAAAATDARVSNIADTIFQVEGRCRTVGASGEYGCYQYLPRTWAAYSTNVAGTVLKQTPHNERVVTEGMVRKWLTDGVSERGIFLYWNQGTPGPDCYRGVNDHGVAYDSCDYAARALRILAEKKNPTTSAGS